MTKFNTKQRQKSIRVYEIVLFWEVQARLAASTLQSLCSDCAKDSI